MFVYRSRLVSHLWLDGEEVVELSMPVPQTCFTSHCQGRIYFLAELRHAITLEHVLAQKHKKDCEYRHSTLDISKRAKQGFG